MHVIARLDEFQQIEQTLCTQKSLLGPSAPQNTIPQCIQQGEAEQNISIRWCDVWIFQVCDDYVNSVLLPEHFLVLLTTVTQISDNRQTKFLYFYRILLPLQKLQQIIDDTLLTDLYLISLFK